MRKEDDFWQEDLPGVYSRPVPESERSLGPETARRLIGHLNDYCRHNGLREFLTRRVEKIAEPTENYFT